MLQLNMLMFLTYAYHLCEAVFSEEVLYPFSVDTLYKNVISTPWITVKTDAGGLVGC